MSDRPVVVTYPDGREYGVKDAATAAKKHPNAKITRYQDHDEPYEAPKAKADKPADKKAS